MKKSPVIDIRADAQSLDAVIMARVISLTVTDNKPTEADKLSITLDDHDGKIALPRRGVVLSVAMGYREPEHGGMVDMGDYVVDSSTWAGTPDTISVEAHAADFKGSLKSTRSISYHGKSFGQIAGEVAQRHSLGLSIAPQFADIPCEHIDQTTESDMHLLTRLCHRYGATFSIKKGKLLIYARATGKTPSGTSLPRITITRKSGDQFSYRVEDKQSEYSGVSASYHDQRSGKRASVSSGEKGKVGKQLKGTYKTKADAEAAAAAEKRRIDISQAKFSISTDGVLSAGSETPITLQGFKDEVDAHQWTVDKATHSYGKGTGIVSQLELIASV